MNFIREVGAILDEHDNLISFFKGTPGSVNFPLEMIKELYKRTPGIRLTHTHPIGLDIASQRDRDMLTAYAFAFYPYPIRLGVIHPSSIKEEFQERVYLAFLEPLEFWKAKKDKRKNKERRVIIKEEGLYLTVPKEFDLFINKSYEI